MVGEPENKNVRNSVYLEQKTVHSSTPVDGREPFSPIFFTLLHTQAREEVQSALEAVEGFASLNRKLVDELRCTLLIS